MAISYTNNLGIVKDGLKTILVTEFLPNKIPIIFSDKFEEKHLKTGEYIRYWCIEDNYIGNVSDGEYREYVFELMHYFNITKLDLTSDFDEWASEQSERLKRLLNNYQYYAPTDVNIWTSLRIDTEKYLLDLADTEELEEDESYENIRVVSNTIRIIRGNFN